MAFDKGFDFRQNQSFISTTGDLDDGVSNCTFVNDIYPATRNGVTFGWDDVVTSIDRDSGVDPRLTGINYVLNGGVARTFRVDLPATGQYTLRLALGDASSGQGSQKCIIKDTNTVLATIGSDDATSATNAGQWIDATNVKRSPASDWVANNALLTVTFATTILNLTIASSDAGDGGATTLAHLFITDQVGGAGTPLTPAAGAASFAGILARPVLGTILTPATP